MPSRGPRAKKSSARLDREIAEALTGRTGKHHSTRREPRASSKLSFPGLRVTKIYPERVDEWYGVAVRFEWVRPFDFDAYQEAVRAEQEAWFLANPKKMHVGLFPLEKVAADHIRREITQSPQWIDFYSKPQRVPRFTARDIDNWDFDGRGGYASASTRD